MTAPQSPDSTAMRAAMVASQLRPNNVNDPRVLDAMATVPREDFVPEARRAAAYVDRSLSFEEGRGLNAPLTTALLLDAAAIGADDAVLIMGQETGYIAALAEMLAASVTVVASGEALPTGKTFDAIVIDGAVEVVDDSLIALLAPTGRLACALIENGVTRLCRGRKGGSGFALTAFADGDAIRLPGFAVAREFVF
jgi:protein-L-isoaspartate(D-aspartate) O-methyltransferase